MLKRSQPILVSMVLPLITLSTLFFVFFLYLPSQAASAIYTVNSTADTNDGVCNVANCTLREAILAANDTLAADTINFSLPPSATIFLSGTVLPYITGTLTIDGSTAVNLTVSGNYTSRVFLIGPLPPGYLGPNESYESKGVGASATVTITHLTIADGFGSWGSAIFNDGTLILENSVLKNSVGWNGSLFNNRTLTVTDSIFMDNASGGAILNHNYGTTTIINSTFISNSATSGGGAVVNSFGQITIQNSTFSNNWAPEYGKGGAIYNFDKINLINTTFDNNTTQSGSAIFNAGTMTVTHNSFNGNVSTFEGAIYNEVSAKMVIVDSTFKRNLSWIAGAIYNRGSMSVAGTVFSGNRVDLANFGRGGSIVNSTSGIITITNSIISGSISGRNGGGGGIYNSWEMNIVDSIINDNSAGTSGGGILNDNSGNLTVLNSTVNNNAAEFSGGGISNNGDLTVINSTVSNNRTITIGFTISGAGLVNFDFGTMNIINSTINDNSGNYDGVGITNRYGELNLSNSIIANSSGGSDCLNEGGTIDTNINNLIEDGNCNPLLNGDPFLGPLQDNGGNTLTHALLKGSPAIDTGHPITCSEPPVNHLDQRGKIRPADGDGDGMAVCDIGAYERYPPLSLSKNAPAVAAAGQFITYTITAGNNLSVTVSHLVLTDTIPANSTYVSGGTLVGNVVSWTVPELSAGSFFTRSFIVTATQTITNDEYRVSASGGYSNTGTTAVVTVVAVPITGLSASNDSPTFIGNPTNLMSTITTGSDVSYAWDFGDGSSDSGQNVAHTYLNVGQYTAVVTASNPLGQFTDSTLVTILDVPIAGLNASNDSPTTVDNPTTLMATVTDGTNVSYTWDFGDGTSGSGAIVIHTYPDVGQYTAVVTASNTSGSAVDTTIVVIEQDTWTIYLPALLKSASSANMTADFKLPIQSRVAILPSRLFLKRLVYCGSSAKFVL